MRGCNSSHVVMEFPLSLGDSCRSSDDSFVIYERYMRSFRGSEPLEEHAMPEEDYDAPAPVVEATEERSLTAETESLTSDSSSKRLAASSDDTTRSDASTKPIITLVSMENSNNATDGVRAFGKDPVFKLPNNELTFNGTLKHLQKLKPIVDPMATTKIEQAETLDYVEVCEEPNSPTDTLVEFSECENHESETESCLGPTELCTDVTDHIESCVESLDARHKELSIEWSSIGGSKGRESGGSALSWGAPPSPDMFSDDEEWSAPHSRLQDILSQHEAYEKCILKRMEKTLSGVLPPPSVTTIKTDVHQMLKKYYSYLPLFHPKKLDSGSTTTDVQSTPSKGVSLVRIPNEVCEPLQDLALQTKEAIIHCNDQSDDQPKPKTESIEPNTVDVIPSLNGSDVEAPEIGTEKEAKEMPWPDILKCRYHGIHYNICTYSERVERAASRMAQRYVGEEMSSTVTVFSAVRSPSSAQKRKALRVKMAQNKSPGRRLSHLARRRQMFTAASLAEKERSGASKVVLIDKNFFPHRKLTHTGDRCKRTPGRKTPGKKTPGKKTPGKSSSRKKMRRLIMDSEPARTLPTLESSKRALFQSPEGRSESDDVPKSNPRVVARRNLFGSTDSGSADDSGDSLKRKRGSTDGESARKLHKSLSFGGETRTSSHATLSRRATDAFAGRPHGELNALHRQKLLWAVSNALGAHGWRLGAPGFNQKASALAQLTKRLLTLPQHAARLAAATSTSDYMLRIARKYVFSVIQGCNMEECYREEQLCLANESTRLTGYISASAYERMKRDVPHTVVSSKIKENTCDSISFKSDQPKSTSKKVLQDKLVNVDSSSNGDREFSGDVGGVFSSNSMPSFKEAARMRARRQITFDEPAMR